MSFVISHMGLNLAPPMKHYRVKATVSTGYSSESQINWRPIHVPWSSFNRAHHVYTACLLWPADADVVDNGKISAYAILLTS